MGRHFSPSREMIKLVLVACLTRLVGGVLTPEQPHFFQRAAYVKRSPESDPEAEAYYGGGYRQRIFRHRVSPFQFRGDVRPYQMSRPRHNRPRHIPRLPGYNQRGRALAGGPRRFSKNKRPRPQTQYYGVYISHQLQTYPFIGPLPRQNSSQPIKFQIFNSSQE